MAVVGELLSTRERVVILGTGLGLFRSESTAGFMGTLAPSVASGREEWIYVANGKGEISCREICDVRILEVDGSPIEEVL